MVTLRYLIANQSSLTNVIWMAFCDAFKYMQLV